MEQERLYTIGEFSELTGATIRTLRYYDKIDLLKPSYKDPDNNRRYYSYPEFVFFDFITRLKKVNMNLTQIKKILNNPDLKESYSLLKKKEDEINEQIDELIRAKNRLSHVQMYIGHLQYTDYPEFPIQLKTIGERCIIFAKNENMKNEKESGIKLYQKFLEIEEKYNALGWYFCIYLDYFRNVDNDKISIQVCREISPEDYNKNPGKHTAKLEGGLFAAMRFKGDNIESAKKYLEMKSWIEENGYEMISPPIFYWINIPAPRKNFTSMNDQIRELQIRIQKKTS